MIEELLARAHAPLYLHAPEQVRLFFESRLYRPVWTSRNGPSPQARAIYQLLQSTDSEGLNPEDFHASDLRTLLAVSWDDEDARERAARLEALLADGFIVYANQITNGRIDPASIDSECTRVPDPVEAHALLTRLARGTDPFSLAQEIASDESGYLQLLDAYKHYRRLAARGGWPELPASGETKPEDFTRLLRRRLSAEGYLEASVLPEDQADATPLEEALVAFQHEHGLVENGKLNDKTLAALNVPASRRAEQIALNLERRRWLPRELGATHVRVNIADFSLVARAPRKEAFHSRTIVGRDHRRTPMMSSKIETVVLNPSWGVPTTIAKKDVLPKVKQDVFYLDRHEMDVFEKATGEQVEPWWIDWDQISAEDLPYAFRQRPGPNNPLGDVKFLFPNPFDVYLHDTPATGLFWSHPRTFSSGCIRVEFAMELARFVLKHGGAKGYENLDERLERVREAKRELHLRLPSPVPIHLVYWTAWVDDENRVHFREDIYERDAALHEALLEAKPCTY